MARRNRHSCAFREKRRLTRARRRTSRRVQYHKHGLVVRARALSGTLVESPGYRWEVRRPSRTRVTLSQRATPRAESEARARRCFLFIERSSPSEGTRRVRVRARHRREHRQDGGLGKRVFPLDLNHLGHVVGRTRDPLSRRRRRGDVDAEQRERAPPGRGRTRGRSAVSRPVPWGRGLGARGRVAARRRRVARDARWRGRRRRAWTLGRRGSARALSVDARVVVPSGPERHRGDARGGLEQRRRVERGAVRHAGRGRARRGLARGDFGGHRVCARLAAGRAEVCGGDTAAEQRSENTRSVDLPRKTQEGLAVVRARKHHTAFLETTLAHRVRRASYPLAEGPVPPLGSTSTPRDRARRC